MFKKILKIIFSIAILVGVIYCTSIAKAYQKERICNDVSIEIKNTSLGEYINIKDIESLLQRKKIYPKDKKLADISTFELELEIKKHPLVDNVVCYKTPSSKIGIDIYQKIPMIKIYTTKGEQFYIDSKGSIMPSGTRSKQPLIIASGNISKEFAQQDLYQFGLFLNKNSFWNSQIEQVYVVSSKEIELYPRVGNHVIYLGDFTDAEKKLERLKVFYDKVLNNVGWNKYNRINIELSNQIICTKAN